MSATVKALPQGSSDYRVLIAGAGPVGLWLAHELALAGVSVLVLEREERRSPHSKALGIQPRTVEVLAMRNRHKDALAAGRPIPSWHFGMLESRIDFRSLPTPFPFLLVQPQTVTEELLERYATELGAVVRRGHEVTSLVQDGSSVTVRVSGPEGVYEVSAPYVVGADGARSTVRREAGIDFPGSDTSAYGFLGEVVLDDPPRIPGFAALSEAGRLLVVPLPGGRFRVTGYDPANQRRDVPLTLDELRDASLRIAGTDFGMRDPIWLSRFGNATRLAAAYRDHRVLLAGDAAHIHWPAGGVGLNVGLQDAMNLGWKLAAVVQGRADAELLDTYHAERHPVGAELAEHTMAQGALITGLTADVTALRGLLNEAIASEPAFAGMLAGKLSGLDTVYRPTATEAHPLTGGRAHDPEGEGVLPLLYDGRAVLLTMGDEPMEAEVAERAAAVGISVHRSRLAETGGPAWSVVTAALIRPDGRVCWATEQPRAGAEFTAEVSKALDGLPVIF
ncbi:2-polyprenyl-6-methoxyphenol hydroxylase-like FAD-dependent oxidoreductase [Streptomyces sp. SAI-135]|uniref:FAD-dependent monooxygenase n=1 Tax=unclassified Streptomyces TaxID=2593676 RepID=UPI002476F038|nr:MULTISPECIES: FAD-dependent monooxygenase [unclassified Streptomyces]MDH6523125.1 2-polyprenyl-6-methoxyphenol hydroxylase-like FAD-dependent oxidoreductase [Streptomyces sp. SAI-090]MDH6554738.1 2-polyprenyl-6-methoxyphenol hydroxylase-like FAD-dependent oxidoreductase [Streptomyces sp. SAI-041]MDH6574010.1 2-polyprenyl-6-methoxyphenol hydroxylase-like FAD-dependent oxidoreductase [Streptomyces sp. SAI-117]MDH6581254.1 2-polyprenyl-6-methoxyphenol hydroxylase-like FAD-dependent oxidoreducta